MYILYIYYIYIIYILYMYILYVYIYIYIYILTKLYQLKERKLVILIGDSYGIHFLQFLFIITKVKRKKHYKNSIQKIVLKNQ